MKKIEKVAPVEQADFRCTLIPCEDSEDMLVDAIKFILELAAASRREAA